MNLSLIIRATDQASSPMGRIIAATRRLVSQGLSPLRRESDRVSTSLSRVDHVGRGIPGMLSRINAAAKRTASGGMRLLEYGTYKAGVGIGSLVRNLAGGVATLTKWGALAAVGGAGAFGAGVIGIGSKFEQFQVILENTEGSAAKARRAMDWVVGFAKATPYELDQVMEAFVRMRAYGIDPTDGSLKSLGNAASGMGKDVMSAVEMIADAQTGEFERLKEFGIKAKQKGNQVTFNWSQNNKDMTRTSTKSASSIRKAILGIFDSRFGGMMDRQSQTFAGMWSNLKDTFTGFELQVARAGVFDMVKGKLGQLLDWVNKKAASGELKRWADQVSAKMTEIATKAADFVEHTDWAKVGRDVKEVAGDIMTLARAIGEIVQAGQALQKWTQDYTPGPGKGLLDKPKAAVQAGYGGAASVWDGIAGWRDRQMQKLPGPIARFMMGSHWQAPSGPKLTPKKALPAVKVGGAIDIRVRTDPGTTAKTTRLSSNNRDVPINLTRGPVLAG